MTLNKAWVLIGVGMLALNVLFDLVLLAMGADGTALALAMVTAISIGGLANYFAVKHYGVGNKPAQNRPEQVAGPQA